MKAATGSSTCRNATSARQRPKAFHAYLDRAYDEADPDAEFSPMDLPCYAADALGIEDVDERVAFCWEYFAAYAGQARVDHIRLMLGFDKIN